MFVLSVDVLVGLPVFEERFVSSDDDEEFSMRGPCVSDWIELYPNAYKRL